MRFMKILIDHDWLGRYRFYLDDNPEYSYFATNSSSIFKGDYADIFNIQGQKVLDLRRGKYSPWKLSRSTYLINGYGDSTIEVKCVSYKTGHWTVNLNKDDYDIYFHGRAKKSLYKNGEQVAKFGCTNDGHFVILNNDEDVLFLIAVFMTFKMGDSAPDDDLIFEIYDDEKDENSKWQPVR
jgi:hypothetical protein